MTRTRWMTRTAILAAISALFATPEPATAQPDSPASMRQAIANLESKLTEAQAELGRIRAERDQLRAEVDRLRRALASGTAPAAPTASPVPAPSGPSGASVPVSALSQEATASPDAMFVAMVLEYRDALMSDATATDLPSVEQVKEWATVVRTKLAGSDSWLVRIDELLPETDDARPRMRATVLDGVTAEPISRPAIFEIPRRLENRFPGELPGGEVLHAEMRVKVAADPVVQPGRISPGPFDFPPFVGPHAGFAYDLDIVGLKFLTADEIATMKNRPRGPVDR